MPKTVYVVGHYPDYINMFRDNGWSVLDNPEEAEYLQFCGGEDVSPSLYGELPHPSTSWNKVRDEKEVELFSKFRLKKKLGICRGAQFCCVMSGGKLWQHVTSHGIPGTHAVLDTVTRKVYQCSSTHHQMMRTAGINVNVANAAVAPFSCTAYDGANNEVKLAWGEEVNFFPATRSLCFQPHPEFFKKDHECQNYYFSLVSSYLGE